jgi:hypothetical protein
MWQVVCDMCLQTETLVSEDLLSRDCAVCGCGQLLGPFAVPRRRFTREVEWDTLTSPHYRHGGVTRSDEN